MWIARDKNNALTLFMHKPIRINEFWCQDDDTSWTTFDLDIELFPELKWENEPIEVYLVSKSVDEEKLDELAESYCISEFAMTHEDSTESAIAYDAYQTGYRKAKEV